MSGISSVTDTGFAQWMYGENYNWSEGTYFKTGDDKAVATIREYLDVNIAAVFQAIHDVTEIVSVTQEFAESVSSIHLKLKQIQTLAEQAEKGLSSRGELKEMQQGIETLVDEINSVTNSANYYGKITNYRTNYYLSDHGRPMWFMDTGGDFLRFPAKDLRVDKNSFDLVSDIDGTLTKIKEYSSNTEEYSEYLNSLMHFLSEQMDILDEKLKHSVSLDKDVFTSDISSKMIELVKEMITAEPLTAVYTQSYFTAEDILVFLQEKD